jgi:hypothetical protein
MENNKSNNNLDINHDGDRFKNRRSAWNWLNEKGFKISRGKFYADCGAGFPKIHRDGTVSRFQVMEHGQRLSLEFKRSAKETPIHNEREELLLRKERAETQISEMKAERAKREQDRDWLHAEDAWASMAAIIGTLRDSIRHHLERGSREIVEISAGNQDHVYQTYEAMDDLISQAFNEVSGAEINVTFEKNSE